MLDPEENGRGRLLVNQDASFAKNIVQDGRPLSVNDIDRV